MSDIPLDRSAIVFIRKKAFKEAAELLERTAQDFEQLCEQHKRNLGAVASHQLKEKAQLLRGQAAKIKILV